MKTIAIDFETANPKPGNACQIGLAWIVGGRVTRVEERFIRPRENWFAFTWVHGITADHVREAPEFPEVLDEFRDELDGALVLAHNAGFDAGVDGGAIGHPGRIFAGGQELAEMHPALPADGFEAFEFGERIGVIVDAQVERRPFLVAVNHKRCRLPAALVAARGFA